MATTRTLAISLDLRLSFHPDPFVLLSSPRAGWQIGNPRSHADYIDRADFPDCWQRRRMTVDIEAKAKELAVVKLMADLKGRDW